MDTLRVISADSHMTEPPDLWTTRLDRRFQDRAPRVVHEPDKPGHFFTAPGITPFPVAGGFSTGRSGEDLKEHLKSGYEAARPSGWDPVERLKDQDLDGVAAEVIYTTLGLAPVSARRCRSPAGLLWGLQRLGGRVSLPQPHASSIRSP